MLRSDDASQNCCFQTMPDAIVEPLQISMLTLNCWGVPSLGSRDRPARMRAIADYLVLQADLHIVCLQEVWRLEDFELIKKHCSAAFPYIHRFTSGVIGSGIVILSKFRFVDLLTDRFSVNGYAHHVHRGDWYGGKVVGLARLYIHQIDNYVSIYGTHLHAEYDRSNDTYLAHRVVQALEICQFIRLTTRPNEFAFLLGDLNVEPTDLGYHLITQVAGLQDAWLEGGIVQQNQYLEEVDGDNKNAVGIGGQSDARKTFVDNANGFTCDRPDNCYSPLKCRPKRIDYVMFKKAQGHKFEVLEKHIDMSRIPHQEHINYSDHHAVRIKFAIRRDSTADCFTPASQLVTCRRLLNDAGAVVKQGVANAQSNRSHFVACAAASFTAFLVVLNPDAVSIGLVMLASFLLALVFGFYVWHGAVVLSSEENALIEAKEELELWRTSMLLNP